nr:unnamed protein product [Callosobruchus analis]
MIRNCRAFTNVDILKILYSSLIRPKLDYGSLVWSPVYNRHVTDIEKVRKRALKLFAFKTDGTYPERGCDYTILYGRFSYDSLELRRKLFSLPFLYKLLHNRIDCIEILNQIKFDVPRLNSRGSLCFNCDKANTYILVKSPVYVMCTNNNKICKHVDIFIPSVEDLYAAAVHLD